MSGLNNYVLREVLFSWLYGGDLPIQALLVSLYPIQALLVSLYPIQALLVSL